ncbi:hypothetical protein [Trabulsiella odontotermitis]|nr:hypothetical protein [Trabulsiella odontotermitis]
MAEVVAVLSGVTPFRCVKEDESTAIEAGAAQTTRYTQYPV